jgi:hypothetical protein
VSLPVSEARTWLESRYLAEGLPVPGFRWAAREAFRAGMAEPGSALLVSDPELRLHLLVLDLGGPADAAALAARVQADLQGGWELRSACLPGEGPGRPGAAAAWRVALHWLGTAEQEAAWRAALVHLRQDGFLLEELAVDASFRTAGETVSQALVRGGCPALLLATRAALRREAAGTALWASADGRVRAALAALEPGGLTPRGREILGELRALAAEAAAEPAQAEPGPASRLGRVTVEHVRGIRQVTLEPLGGPAPVQAWVVSGPNGSGKSSLAEAVSLRVFGSSRGLCGYLQDPDVSKGKHPTGYLDRYLAPLAGGRPRCALDGDAGQLVPAPDLETALAGLAEAEGTLVEAGGPGAFLRTPGEDLGARMARSFSALAIRLEAWVAAARAEAAEARTALARRHGISPSTRLAASFREKIARALVDPYRAKPPRAVTALLAALAGLPGPAGPEAAALRDAWLDAAEQGFEHLARPETASREALETALQDVFAGDAERAGWTGDLCRKLAAAVAGLGFATAGLGAHLRPWATWLERPREPVAPAPAAPARSGLDELLARRAALAAEGSRTRPQHDHLAQALAFLRAHGTPEHERDCPTCGTRLDRPVMEAVAALLAEAAANLQAQRDAYAALSRQIKALEGETPGRAEGACPVPAEIRRQLQAFVTAVLDPGAQAEDLVRDPAARACLEQLLAASETIPAPAAAGAGPREEASACAAALLASWAEAERVLAEPEAWDQVAAALTGCLTQVVAEHLPATLEGLWRELAACLSPAPWLIPAPPRFQTRTLRGSNRVEVVLDGPDGEPRLARHLLNTAQADTLGLAWSFCRHLVQGRFRHAWLLLDDPARDMDQAAHRAFCRFLASLAGLYQASGSPFTLVLLAGQQERALDAARELGAGVLVLGWTGRQEDAAVKRLVLFGEGVRSPQPEDLWGIAAG